MSGVDTVAGSLRQALAGAVRSRVAGPGARSRAGELWDAPGPRWFGPDRPIRAVHADTAMFLGGLRALLLQSLHPLAMAGVAQHSEYRRDPWGRLQRTADFLAATTFGPADEAEQACARVLAVHHHVRGIAPDGRPYAAADPHLMRWVHVAEADSFLAAHQRYGARRLAPAEADGYIADLAVVARRLGITDPPTDVAGLRRELRAYRPELHGTAEARDAARFLLVPPLPLAARGPYAVGFAAAVGLLPWWARLSLRLPPVTPVADALVRPAARVLVDVLRWALTEGAHHPSAAEEDEVPAEPCPAP